MHILCTGFNDQRQPTLPDFDYFQLVSARNNQVKYFLMKKGNNQLKHYYLEFIGNNNVILHCDWFFEFYFNIDISMLPDDVLMAIIEKGVDELYYTSVFDVVQSLSDKLKIELVDRM